MYLSTVCKRTYLVALATAGLILATISCNNGLHEGFLGSAVIEGTTYQIAAPVSGILEELIVDEGDRIEEGMLVAVIDTQPVVLQLKQTRAAHSEVTASIESKQKETVAMLSEIKGLEREVSRLERLVSSGSAPQQKLDNLETSLETARQRYRAAQVAVSALRARLDGIDAQRALLELQKSRCYIYSQTPGTVITRFHNKKEIATPATILYEVSREDTLYADFFVPQPLLPTLRIGQEVRVRVDNALMENGEQFEPATISWISSQAEFSPKNIQTRESRNELIFRIRVKIDNTESTIKRGLPVEIWR